MAQRSASSARASQSWRVEGVRTTLAELECRAWSAACGAGAGAGQPSTVAAARVVHASVASGTPSPSAGGAGAGVVVVGGGELAPRPFARPKTGSIELLFRGYWTVHLTNRALAV